MIKAVKITQAKIGHTISRIVKAALPLSIYAIELELFVIYIKQLALGFETDLKSYMKVLTWNNYLKIKFDDENINKLAK